VWTLHGFLKVAEEIAEKYSDKLKVCKFNVDNNSETIKKYNISSIPSVLLFKNGKVVDKITGLHPRSCICQMIDKHL
jgi:thioredoxin 1